MSLINLNDVTVAFGGPPLLDGVNVQFQRGERVCILGRNGAGKTTLLRLIHGALEPDQGAVARQQGVTSALLTQEVPGGIEDTVFDVVLSGLGKRGELPAEYHHLSVRLAEEGGSQLLEQLDKIQKMLETGDGWDIHRQAETVITRMQLDPEALFPTLSAGLKRRVLLARALVCQPDILLLDEPTNHLDIDAITWLEEFLLRYNGTLLFVTHDRVLVRKLSTRIIELDRGRLTSWDCNYETFLERKEAAMGVERQQWDVFDKKLAKEEAWLRQGVKARRTRNEGRVKALLKMREERRVRRDQLGAVSMGLQDAKRSGKLVIDAENVTFTYEPDGQTQTKTIIRDFNTLVMRGDRVGIIGSNGCGKTTLLRVLLGDLQPQQGSVRQGTNLEIAYFDQLRGQFDEEKSVLDNVADGNDRVVLNGKNLHIIGYLQEFLFTPERARTPVKVLSGGERNRLLLAKLFAKPANLLVMDEPTNDLDIETLELLEELLMDFPGTLLLVSHDRAFLDNVVTNTLVFESTEPGGQLPGERTRTINDYIGGYGDWLKQRKQTEPGDPEQTPVKTNGKRQEFNKKQDKHPGARPRKLTNKEKHELDTLPRTIEDLEHRQEELFQKMSDPAFYQQDDGAVIAGANRRVEELKQELAGAYQRWEELEELHSKYLNYKK